MRRLAAALAACVVPAAASAEYYVNLSLAQFARGTCGTSGVNVPVSGTIYLDLPVAARNIYVLSVVQGLPGNVEWKSVGGPFPQAVPSSGNLTLATPAVVAPPYSLVVAEFPALHDEPLGYGTRMTADCAADGSATIAFDIGVPAPPPPAVPALASISLAWMALALVAAAAPALRRRVSPRRRT